MLKIPHNEVDEIVKKLNSYPAPSKQRRKYAQQKAAEYGVVTDSIYNLFKRKKHGSPYTGESHPRAKLKNAQVLELRKEYAEKNYPRGFIKETARKLGMSMSALSKALSGRSAYGEKAWQIETKNKIEIEEVAQ